jgi:TRAP-type mannitol/chloroaromatic compound transport system permease small subunit
VQPTLRVLLSIAGIIDRLNQLIGRLLYGVVLLMVGVGVWNVVGRYLGRAVGQNLSSNALIETQWYLFDLVFLLGAAYTLQQNEHVRVDIFYSQWSPKRKAWVNLLGTLLFLLPFCVLVLYFSWDMVLASWRIQETSPDPGGLPRYPIKTMIPLCFVLLILQGFAEIVKNLALILRPAVPNSPSALEEDPHAGL